VFSGITFRTWPATRGRLDADAIGALIAPGDSPYLVSTTAIAVENTHNFGGGTIQPADRVAAVQQLARAHDIGLHLDGARLWNAHVATGIPLAELAGGFDTVSVCLSKGLGAPVGSVLVSSAERIAQARIWRKRYGGGMRQVGILAAAGRYALAHNIDRLADDHANARIIAEAVRSSPGLQLDPEIIDTNIVIFELDPELGTAASFVARLRDEGVWMNVTAPQRIRAVTHLDVSREQVQHAAAVLQETTVEVQSVAR
jgi:threonine aldolase